MNKKVKNMNNEMMAQAAKVAVMWEQKAHERQCIKACFVLLQPKIKNDISFFFKLLKVQF